MPFQWHPSRTEQYTEARPKCSCSLTGVSNPLFTFLVLHFKATHLFFGPIWRAGLKLQLNNADWILSSPGYGSMFPAHCFSSFHILARLLKGEFTVRDSLCVWSRYLELKETLFVFDLPIAFECLLDDLDSISNHSSEINARYILCILHLCG